MPKFLLPRRHGAHRIAAIALYRALLSQLSAISSISLPILNRKHRDDLRSIIRHRFRRNATLQSKALLSNVFTSGWSILDSLDTLADHHSTSSLRQSALQSLESYIASSPSVALLSRLASESHPPSPSPRAKIFPNPDATLLRRPIPTPELTGARKIPVLVSANRFPYLRLGKPQPPALSAYIESMIKVRQSRYQRIDEYQTLSDLGAKEDFWDLELQAWGVHAVKGSWARAGKEAVREVNAALERRDELSKERTRWYMEIIEGETEERERERRERVMERNVRAWDRKKRRIEAEGGLWIEKAQKQKS